MRRSDTDAIPRKAEALIRSRVGRRTATGPRRVRHPHARGFARLGRGGPGRGTGDVPIGEVSTADDDEADNVFEDDPPRFAAIEEEAPSRWLASDYGRWGS